MTDVALACNDDNLVKLFESAAPVNFWCYKAATVEEAAETVKWAFWAMSKKVGQGDFIFTVIVADGQAPKGAFICSVADRNPIG